MYHPPFAPMITVHRVASQSGSLRARVITPPMMSDLPPLVVLHGISRNADELVELFRPEAERTGRRIVVPHFSEKKWLNFQRPSRSARPDRALLALLSHLAILDPAFAGPVDLFGHSGGAQLAHRFAMLYPHKVGRLNLVAAGWYCLPDTSMAYPYGLGTDATPGSHTWARRHDHNMPAFLRLSVRVFVGTEDTLRDASLRQNPGLDRIQGRTRIARAETYVERFRLAARAKGILPDINLMRMPGVTHDVAKAITQARLARLVTEAEPALLAVAS
ncbi:alpha/beta hydrolase [Paracoccus salsus]|uniref:alpha/beta hydrolase n=1 Tax=Paracoccus salsus TaxID=2911061 RepID=UPI001F26D59D|nr:alpha/beta hydrolase [Paracoccus salsus]MCF3975085.1 alpha/beta hydrolase [Paracoccus salsus]